MATSGLIVKNAAVSLVNGVYHKYSDNTKGRRWLSSDKLCMMHYSEQSCYNKVDVDLDSYVTPEMTTKRYYKYNTVDKEYTPINLIVSSSLTINDQLGNTEKHLVASSISAEPRLLTTVELAQGQTHERAYWLHNISVPVGDTDDTVVLGVVVEFPNMASGDTAYVQVASDKKAYVVDGVAKTVAFAKDPITVGIKREGSETYETVSDIVQFPFGNTVSYICNTDNGLSLTNKHTKDDSYYLDSDVRVSETELLTIKTVETRNRRTIARGHATSELRIINTPKDVVWWKGGYVDGTTDRDLPMISSDEGIMEGPSGSIGEKKTVWLKLYNEFEVPTRKTAVITLENVVSGRAYFTLDLSGDEIIATNDNTYDQAKYTCVLCYTTPVYLLATETNMNHWSISRVDIKETGIELKDELYCAFAENNSIDPWAGIPWICIDGGNSTLDSRLKVEYWDESSVKSSTVTTTDPDGAIRTVTTFVNIITGETYTDTQVVRQKTVYNQKDVVRYDYVNLSIGKIYRFRFAAEFEKLGWIPGDKTQPINAGIYKVDSIMSYYDSVIGRIDLYVNLYEKCGVSKTVFDADKKRFADTVIYRLVDPTDESKIYFMPQIFIEGQPDASVLKYNKLLMMVDLGIQPNSNTVSELTNTNHPAVAALNRINDMGSLIKKVLEKEYGLAPTETNPLVKFSVYGYSWLTDDGFNSLETDRKATMARSTVDFNKEFRCDESNKWYLENLKLRARLGNQEALIKRLLNKRTGN